ncbi:hypothetical protein ACN28C_05975 [Plantactinospora sp. WMMC1484]|uniref:hypothetical protein n=1 Tax=Plantactinospora sp. WMMC1484 TaxID=3404122 RepID=UPI003BF4E1D6
MPDDVSIPRQDGSVPRQDGAPRAADPAGPAGRGDGGETTPEGASIVSWGGRARTGRRGGALLSRLGRDARLVPVIGAAGAAAVFASLLGDWAVTTMPAENVPSETPITLGSGVADMSAFGTAYLVGVFGVVGCLALVFFGSPGVRHNARVAGLAGAGVTLGVLLATTGTLDTLGDRWQVYGELEGMTIEYGQGLVLAYVGTGGLGLALLLAGRFVRRPAAEAAPGAGPEVPAGPAPEESDWPWRRPGSAHAAQQPEDDEGLPPPIDLTVTPTKPFTR